MLIRLLIFIILIYTKTNKTLYNAMKYIAFLLILITSISHAESISLTDKQFIQALDYFNDNRMESMKIIIKGDAGNPDPLAIPIAFCKTLYSLEDEEKFVKKYPNKHHLLHGNYFLSIEKGKEISSFMINEYAKHGFQCSKYVPVR